MKKILKKIKKFYKFRKFGKSCIFNCDKALKYTAYN